MRTSLVAVLLAALAACGCSKSKGVTDPGTGSAGSGVSSGTDVGSASGTGSGTGTAAAPAPGPGIGETCGTDDACAAGLECVKYLGIAGAQGPQFKTCEKRCAAQSDCPDGRKCATIADGPGQVCR